jgi:hypothetical protein
MNLAAKWFLVAALGALIAGMTGCSTGEPQNASVRPWNAPQSWEGTLPFDNGQHP